MSKILLIIGAGPNIGSAVAKSFSSAGYKVAAASRSPPKSNEDINLHVPVDLSKPEDVPGMFEKVRKELGEPGVVVYNAAIWLPDPKPDALSLFNPTNIASYNTSQAINFTSVMTSIAEAVKSFRTLDTSASKAFIFTGNLLNQKMVPGALNFSLGKGQAANGIKWLVESGYGKDDGIKFYYADERAEDGDAVYASISGEAAAEEYLRIAERKDQGSWLYTFVKGIGYKEFPRL